jgi:glycosyltransferase involved in cell wall biosynthesis
VGEAIDTTVLFSNVRADHIVQRHHYVAQWRAERGRVVWLDTLGSRNPKPSDLKRIGGERAGQDPSALLPRATIARPRFLPLLGSKQVAELNRRWLERQLLSLGVDPAHSIAWVYLPHPSVVELLERGRWARVVFDLCDDIDDMEVHPSLRAGERRLLTMADVVFATSAALTRKAAKARRGRGVHHVPNGVDSARFASQGRRPPGALRRVLYAGALCEWLDEELLVAVARERPDLEFHLVGPQRRPLRRLGRLPNVAVRKPIDAASVPDEIVSAQLCMIPFRPGPLTEATDPLKLYEALISERPVLATALGDARRFEPAVRLETTPGGWLRALADLERGHWHFDAEAYRRRMERDENWRQRFDRMDSVLESSERA